MIKEDFEKIRFSEQFRPILSPSFLVSCFLNESLPDRPLWEYNFLSRENNKIYTFIVDNEKVILKETSFLTNNKTPKELLLNNLRLDKKEVLALATYFLLNKFKEDKISRTIVSIEMDSEIVWNISIILKNLQIIHIKINDKTSQVIKDKVMAPFTSS